MSGRPADYRRVLNDASVENHKNAHPASAEYFDTNRLLSPDIMAPDSNSNSPHLNWSPFPSPYTPPLPDKYGAHTQPYQPPPEDYAQYHTQYQPEPRSRRFRYHCADLAIILLALYSTLFSALWLLLAIIGPFYGFIGVDGGLSPTVASTLVAAFAKTIELSFVTVFVSFLGQFLSRTALSPTSGGITLADMHLRTYLLQPGLIVSSWHSFRLTMKTALGIFTLVATLVSLFYTTASDALVSPKPSLRYPQMTTLGGYVPEEMFNRTLIRRRCPSAVSVGDDPIERNATCSQIEHAGSSYHNYLGYTATWQNYTQQSPETRNALGRPAPIGMLFDNTTAQGAWLHPAQKILKRENGRIINNVTVALPHSGVYAAAMNGIAQRPHTGQSAVESRMRVEAQVVSPAINVLCASVTKEELQPLVFAEWPEWRVKNQSDLIETFPHYPEFVNFSTEYNDWKKDLEVPADFNNRSVLDDIFQLGDPGSGRPRPVFPKLPLAYNSVFNFTKVIGPELIYLLFASETNDPETPVYTVCGLSATTEQGCSTELDVSVGGGAIKANCDNDNKMAFISSEQERRALRGWTEVGYDWAVSISLGSGLTDSAASSARTLALLAPQTDVLNDTKPTIAESLAVLSLCTGLDAGIEGPFDQKPFSEPGRQEFAAQVQISGYMSGSPLRWQRMFNVILAAAFVINCFTFGYHCHLYRIKGIVSDYMEQHNMFALALHSPADRRLAGTSTTGPGPEHLSESWYIKEDYNRQLFIGDGMRRRGHSSWMSHAPSGSRQELSRFRDQSRSYDKLASRIEMSDMDFDRQEGKPPKAYKPGIKDGITRTLGNVFGDHKKGDNDGKRARYE